VVSISSTMRPIFQWLNYNILIPVSLCFIFGTTTGYYLPSLFSQTVIRICSGLLLALALLLYYNRKKTAVFVCLPLFFILGHFNSMHHSHLQMQPEHIFSKLPAPRQVTLVGTLATMVERGNKKNRFDLKVHKILIHGEQQNWHPVHGKIRLSLRGAIDELQPGMLLMIKAKAGPITNFKTPGSFNYKGYMAAKNIHVSGWIKNQQDIIPVQETLNSSLSIRYLPEQIRQRVAKFIRKNLPHNIAGLYQALLVGSRAGVTPDVLEQFKATGTMHLLAISGIHMGLLGLMVGSLLNFFLRKSEWLLLNTHVPSLALLGTLPILLGYGFIAGMNTPVLRALIMATILLTSVLLRRQYDLLHLIAGAALFILIFNPLSLFTVSFQLSFAAVTAMALLLPKLSWSPRKVDCPPEKKGPIKRYTQTALLISLTATLGTLPFMLYHFNRVSLIGPVMNLLIEPLLCFWALPFGLAAIPCMFIAPQAASFLLQTGSLGIKASLYCSATASAIPLASIWTITPTMGEMLFFWILIFCWHFRNKNNVLVPAGIILGACCLLLHFTIGLFGPQPRGDSQVTFLDVGQGNSTFLHLPDGSRVLIDGGGGRNNNFNSGERIIAPYLWNQRIWRLDQAVITHPHSDHFNGMDFLLNHFRPKSLFINGDQRSEGNYTQIIELAKKLGTQIIIPETGKDIVTGKNFQLTGMGMNGLGGNSNRPVNDKCLVFRYSHGKRSFFFPADISSKSEHLLMQKWENLHSDVLLASHHGSATASSPAFIEAINPSFIVVSAGKNGQRYYPDPKNLADWQKKSIQTFITRNDGTVTCTTDGISLDCTPYKNSSVAWNEQPRRKRTGH